MRTSLWILVYIVITMIYIPGISHAMSRSETVTWQLIFLSRYGGCTNYQYQMTNEYDEVTRKYFDLYKFENSGYAPQCMPDAKYSHYKPPTDLDLLILVYDYEIGRQDLNANDLGGVYTHHGHDMTKNHVIIFCDCPNFRFSDPVWILSHELSHFITYYLGFDRTVVEDTIHALDARYDKCIEISYDQSCAGVKTHVSGDHYFTTATVMAPYPPAVGKKLILEKNETTHVSDGTEAQIVMSIQKEVTKWWLEGKINDTDYSTVLQQVIGQPGAPMATLKASDVVFADGPDGQKNNDTYYDVDSQWGKKKASIVLNRVPFRSEDPTSAIQSNHTFPEWFKSRAKWWSEGIIWNDKEFLSGARYLFSNNTAGK